MFIRPQCQGNLPSLLGGSRLPLHQFPQPALRQVLKHHTSINPITSLQSANKGKGRRMLCLCLIFLPVPAPPRPTGGNDPTALLLFSEPVSLI